jgi:hypothetical protein
MTAGAAGAPGAARRGHKAARCGPELRWPCPAGPGGQMSRYRNGEDAWHAGRPGPQAALP